MSPEAARGWSSADASSLLSLQDGRCQGQNVSLLSSHVEALAPSVMVLETGPWEAIRAT